MTACLLCNREWSGKEDDVLCAIRNGLLAASQPLQEASKSVIHKEVQEIASCPDLCKTTITPDALALVPDLAKALFGEAMYRATR